MMLPVFILIADIAMWWLTYDISSRGDQALTLVVGLVAVALVIWLILEVYQLSEAAIPKRSAGPDDF